MSVTLDKQKVISVERLLDHQYGRIRALLVGEDGSIYFSTSQKDPPEGKPMKDYDMICRIRPAFTTTNFGADSTTMNAIAEQTKTKKTIKNIYIELCASCHGKNMEGTERAKTMLDKDWMNGGSKKDIFKSTHDGIIDKGMPAWQGALTDKEIDGLAKYIFKVNAKAVRLARK